MTFSFSQKLRVFVIQLIIQAIWLVDITSAYLKSGILAAFIIFTVFATGIYKLPSIVAKDAIFFREGLVASMYPRQSIFVANNVLGAATYRQIPFVANKIPMPTFSAKSILVMDATRDKVLLDINSSRQLAPASTTKLMTALVALDLYALTDTLTVPYLCTLNDSQRVGLKEGTAYFVKDLLYGLLVDSGGDCACTLAVGKVDVGEFVNLMNQKAVDFGLSGTHFTNPVGFDGSHYSTAYDLYQLAKKAVSVDLIHKFVATKSYSFASVDAKDTITIFNTNKLLWDLPGSIGVKTGQTQEAGEVLVYEYRDVTKTLISVVMGSQDRFADTKAALDWVFQSYSWK